MHRLVDENDNDVPVGQPGEALLKGPVITQGYHNNPEANAAGFTKDGWYRTGDLMQFGEDSDLLYVVGRTKVSHYTSPKLFNFADLTSRILSTITVSRSPLQNSKNSYANTHLLSMQLWLGSRIKIQKFLVLLSCFVQVSLQMNRLQKIYEVMSSSVFRITNSYVVV